MPIRNTHRVGDYLMRDDESGLIHYRSDMVKRWDGLWVHKTQFETRHPQEFVRARNDPKALRNVRPEDLAASPVNCISGGTGETSVRPPDGPASHLFRAGIGKMVVEGEPTDPVFEVV